MSTGSGSARINKRKRLIPHNAGRFFLTGHWKVVDGTPFTLVRDHLVLRERSDKLKETLPQIDSITKHAPLYLL